MDIILNCLEKRAIQLKDISAKLIKAVGMTLVGVIKEVIPGVGMVFLIQPVIITFQPIDICINLFLERFQKECLFATVAIILDVSILSTCFSEHQQTTCKIRCVKADNLLALVMRKLVNQPLRKITIIIALRVRMFKQCMTFLRRLNGINCAFPDCLIAQ